MSAAKKEARKKLDDLSIFVSTLVVGNDCQEKTRSNFGSSLFPFCSFVVFENRHTSVSATLFRQDREAEAVKKHEGTQEVR